MTRRKTVILGAGALGLGFFGPVATAAGEVRFLDVIKKQSIVDGINLHRRYAYSIARGDDVRSAEVQNVRAAVVTDRAAVEALSDCDLCFTAVGASNLANIAPLLREAAQKRISPLVVLCGENGVNVASFLSRLVGENENIVCGDTVAARMCRWIEECGMGYVPLFEGSAASLVTDDTEGIPFVFPIDTATSPTSSAKYSPSLEDYALLRSVEEGEFALLDHIKLFGHNCLHGLYAFSAARLNMRRILEVEGSSVVRERADRMMFGELAPALAYHYDTAFDPIAFEAYIDQVKSRIFSKGFNEPVARGIRGVREKLAPAERWVQAIRFVRSAGIRPTAFLEVMADIIIISSLLEEMLLENVLKNICEFTHEETDDALSVLEPLAK